MLEQQTIFMKIEDLSVFKDDDDNFISTNWDELCIDTHDAILNDYKIPISITNMVSGNMLIQTIQFRPMNPEEEKNYRMQKMNLEKPEIVTEGIKI